LTFSGLLLSDSEAQVRCNVGSAWSFPLSSLRSRRGVTLPLRKNGLAQEQTRSESNDQSRSKESQEISSVERLKARIAQGVEERGNSEHQDEQTRNDPRAPLTLLSFGLVYILRLARSHGVLLEKDHRTVPR
jgi:hypothetical protein